MDRLAADPEYQAEEKKNSQWRIKEAYQALVELRRSHLDFMKIPIVTILRSRCEDCYAYDLHVRKKYEESDEQWRPPDIAAATWKADLSALGVTKAEIHRILNDPEFSLGCNGCNHWMIYGVDNIYTPEESFTSYFEDLLPGDLEALKRSPPKWMKRLVFDAYLGRCFGCEKVLTWEEKSTDHIVPRSRGGLTELANLQLLCRNCDERRKDNLMPEEQRFHLYFLLIPTPLDGHAGLIW